MQVLPVKGMLGRISLSGNPAPQLTLWLLLEGLQLLMVTSHSFINYIHTNCLESARHLAKGFTCKASFSPLLTVSCPFLCSLGYRLNQLLHVDGQDAPIQPRWPTVPSPPISPGHSIENYDCYYSAYGEPQFDVKIIDYTSNNS